MRQQRQEDHRRTGKKREIVIDKEEDDEINMVENDVSSGEAPPGGEGELEEKGCERVADGSGFDESNDKSSSS